MPQGTVMVLGAGIVGVSIALQLQRRGFSTALVDLQLPGSGTSLGNAGLIQREAVLPHPFPRSLPELLHYARNQSTEMYYHPSALPALAIPFLRYRYYSQKDRYRVIAQHYGALLRPCVEDHTTLAMAAGAMDLLRPGGWLQVHRRSDSLARALAEAVYKAEAFGVTHTVLDAAELMRREPSLAGPLAGAIHWTQPWAVSDPYALTQAYLGLFLKLGGVYQTGDARSLRRTGSGWQVSSAAGPVEAAQAVVAMGAWSMDVTRTLGYTPPLFGKRGYHQHYAPPVEAALTSPVLDAEAGYVLAPMRRGIRLTTGAEFARRDAPPCTIPLERAERQARRLLPGLGARLDPQPWMGVRPCVADMLPIIGRAPGQPGLWYAFGHCHQGLTMGPTTGRLLTAMMAGETPFIDPTPYRPERF